jgi:TolA-binding protein
MNQFHVGRRKEATKAFHQIISKYPGSKAAEQAQEQFYELEPKDKDR